MKTNLKSIIDHLLNGSLQVDQLVELKDDLYVMYKSALKGELSLSEIKDLIMIYMDFYTYTTLDEILISDYDYDQLMNYYIDHGGSLISTSHILKSDKTQWNFVVHEAPGSVGTVKKTYDEKELRAYVKKNSSNDGYFHAIIAPKFDGISSAIKIDYRGRILQAVTRNDGYQGQDITDMVRNCGNASAIGTAYGVFAKDTGNDYVWTKTELCVGLSSFASLVEEKAYKNRRSATSGIVNSPKNVHLAKYVDIIPLATYVKSSEDIFYRPKDSIEIRTKHFDQVMEYIDEMFSKIRDASYEYRVDGVVIYPIGDWITPNYNDFMDNAIAYKINTQYAMTTIDYAYCSIGRLGGATPMVHVNPVEVNETIVQDVSLGSFDIFAGMDLHEHEQILVYSAGDVIPQAKLPEHRNYREGAPLIQIPKICPYCNMKLTRYKNSYFCRNERCPRVSAGRITNFLVKLNVKDISDRTIEDFMGCGLIHDIPDLFHIKESDIARIDRYGEDSAHNIVTELQRIRTMEIPVSKFLGALGIQGISEKKCRKITKVVPLNKMLEMKKKKLADRLWEADDTGSKTIEIFCDFIKENRGLITELLECMNIRPDPSWIGNVVFTGFRDDDLAERFASYGYEVSNNVNSDTLAVITKSPGSESSKTKAARKKGISIIYFEDIYKIFEKLKKEKK